MGVTQLFGDKHEKDVAFHLRRRFKDANDVRIFHNLRLECDGEHAQIDHLVLHKYGFIVIESKSIHGEVQVNEHREWSRSYQGKWTGIPSPVQQADNQIKILRLVLHQNKANLLGKVLGLQEGFGGRKYDVLIAISSSAIIQRKNMSDDISRLVVKAEFIPEQVTKVIKGHSGILNVTTNPAFSKRDLQSIADFLEAHAHAQSEVSELIKAQPKPTAVPAHASLLVAADDQWEACCKHCNNTAGLEGKWGKFGYYLICPQCQKNTPLKRACPKCEADTKLSKRKSTYAINCTACGEVGKIVVR